MSISFWKSCHLRDNAKKCGAARQATDDNIIWRMHFACWITKARDTHSEYVILLSFLPQQWLRKRVSLSRLYVHCPSYYYTDFNITVTFVRDKNLEQTCSKENVLQFTSWQQSKSKAVPLHTWSGPEGSRKLRFPDFMTMAQDGGQPYAPAAFTPRKYSWYSFLLEAESTPGP